MRSTTPPGTSSSSGATDPLEAYDDLVDDDVKTAADDVAIIAFTCQND